MSPSPLKGAVRWAEEAETGLPVCSPCWKPWDLPQGYAWGHRSCFHLIHQPCSEQWCWWARGIPQLGLDLLGVLSGFRGREQLPCREGNEGGRLEKHLGLLFQYIQGFACVQDFGLFFFLSQVFALPWDSGHYGSVKFKWKVPVPVWGFSNKKVKWFICPFYLSEVLQCIFTKVSYFVLGENTCDFVNATFVVDSAAPWKGTYILVTVGSSHICFLFFPCLKEPAPIEMSGNFPIEDWKDKNNAKLPH